MRKNALKAKTEHLDIKNDTQVMQIIAKKVFQTASTNVYYFNATDGTICVTNKQDKQKLCNSGVFSQSRRWSFLATVPLHEVFQQN